MLFVEEPVGREAVADTEAAASEQRTSPPLLYQFQKPSLNPCPSYPVVSRSPVKKPVDHAAALGGLNPSRQGPGFAPAAAAARQGKQLGRGRPQAQA